jgi:hypothetical protein
LIGTGGFLMFYTKDKMRPRYVISRAALGELRLSDFSGSQVIVQS